MLKILFICYFSIGFIFYIYIKNMTNSIDINSLLEMIDNNENIKDIDFNKPLPQFLFFIFCILLWPMYFVNNSDDNLL